MSKRIAAIVALVVVFAATAAVGFLIWQDRTGEDGDASASAADSGSGRIESPAAKGLTNPLRPATDAGTDVGASVDSEFALEPAPVTLPVKYRVKHPPAAGVLFDVDSGEVLWERHPTVERPIASLTKMMTALIVAE